MKTGDFYVNGFSGMNSLNATLVTLPAIPKPKRKRTVIPLIGGSQSALADESSYENREFDIQIGVRAKTETEMVTLGDKLFSVFDSSGYIPFSYYGESEYTYHVFNADLVETERLLRTSWVRVYTYNLSAAAFKYFDPGQRRNVSNGDTLVNPFEYEAKPYIKLMGTGNVTLTIAGKAYNYAGVDGFLEIDSDELQQDLYKTNADGTVTFQNEKAQASQAFPTLQKGRNLISWSGNITNLEIEPRWRSI